MKISDLEINNYRNLDGIRIKFHHTINFIIGENNLGKSNLLDLLNILFNRNNFAESDFLDSGKQICIIFSVLLSEVEQGFFEDLFDPCDRQRINIVATQESPDDSIKFQHKETGTSISAGLIKCINYINYDSLRNPSSELSFSRNRGVGRFLNHIISKYLQDGSLHNIDFVSTDKIDEFLVQINKSLQKIKSFKDFSIQAVRDENRENLLARIILLADGNNQSLEKLGYGVQFSLIITLSILERLLSLSKQRLEKCILEDTMTSEKCIPVLIGLDEPEIHLHPYAQRSLIKYLYRIIENNELDFSSLLTDIFQVNRLLGQILIVSHSPNVLLDDYKQILRFYKDENGKLIIRNGSDIQLELSTEKQLLKNLPYIKEGFFSKTVILVEGDSELAALNIFSERLKIDLDEYGISIVQAGSAESIPPLMKLLNEFGINNIALMDADKDKKDKYSNIQNLSFTEGIDFEEDLYNSFDIADYAKYLEEEFFNERKTCFFIGKAKNIGISLLPKEQIYPQLASLPEDKRQEIKNNSKQEILNYLRDNKSILTGRDLGKYVTEIPRVYEELIQKAVQLSRDAK